MSKLKRGKRFKLQNLFETNDGHCGRGDAVSTQNGYPRVHCIKKIKFLSNEIISFQEIMKQSDQPTDQPANI